MSTTDDLSAVLSAAGVDRVYEVGAVPAKPAHPYAVLSNAPSAPEVRRLSGSGDPAGRFTVQHFGKTADSIEAIAALTFAAFDGKPLPLDGTPVARQEIATTPYRDPDDQGVLSVLHTYRY